MSFHGIF